MKNKIYSVINEFLDSYVIEGVNPQQFLNYLNTDEDNFKLIYHKIYRKLTIEGVSFESKELTECLVDSIRDKIALLNDLNQGKPALPETIITQHPANTLNENQSNFSEYIEVLNQLAANNKIQLLKRIDNNTYSFNVGIHQNKISNKNEVILTLKIDKNGEGYNSFDFLPSDIENLIKNQFSY